MLKFDSFNRPDDADNEMKTPTEERGRELLRDSPMDILVPGLYAVAKDLRTAFPNLSEESVARILGLPTGANEPDQPALRAYQKRGTSR